MVDYIKELEDEKTFDLAMEAVEPRPVGCWKSETRNRRDENPCGLQEISFYTGFLQ